MEVNLKPTGVVPNGICDDADDYYIRRFFGSYLFPEVKDGLDYFGGDGIHFKLPTAEMTARIESHALWLKGDPSGKRLNASGEDLSCTIFTNCDFRKAIFNGTDFNHSWFVGCDFSNSFCVNSNFRNSGILLCFIRNGFLCNSEFESALIHESEFLGTDITGASFKNARIEECMLKKIQSRDIDLSGTYFDSTTVKNCQLTNVNFNDSYIFESSFINNTFVSPTFFFEKEKVCDPNVFYKSSFINPTGNMIVPFICPESGPFIGFKRARHNKVVVLEIPAHAKRSSALSRKCRCSEAKVVDILDYDGNSNAADSVESIRDPEFVYKIGETVKVDNFCGDRWNECSEGIHFFMSFKEATHYY